MDNNQALLALIDHGNASDKPATLSWDETQQWDEGVLERLVDAGLLVKDVNTQSLQCTGCEHHCFMPVYLTEDKARAFIVCDHPDMQSQMGRVNVPLDRLQQWQTSAKQFAVVVAGLLEIDAKPSYLAELASYKLGMLQSGSGRRWVSLSVQPMAIVINGHSVPLQDLIYFNDDALIIDWAHIDSLLNSAKRNTGKAYTSNVDKRESRKQATLAMYQDWHDELLKLTKTYPKKTDTWYALQISKLEIAQGRNAETIRKHMKK